jgi:hypothetical protein
MTKVKYLDITEFREIGLLQEVNRRLLHPCGLALEIVVQDDGTMKLGGVWDYREDPEGMTYSDAPSAAKAARVDALIEQHRVAREALFGAILQPATREDV